MGKRIRRFVLVPALLLAGCATKSPVPVTRPAPAPVTRPVPAQALSPEAYVARIASIELFLARGCALAAERSSNPTFRAEAAKLAADHRGLSAQLRMAGQRLNLLPAPVLGLVEQRWLEMLAGSQPFEVGFRRRMLSALQEAVALHEAFANSGSSPTLRQFARYAVGVERSHVAGLLKSR